MANRGSAALAIGEEVARPASPAALATGEDAAGRTAALAGVLTDGMTGISACAACGACGGSDLLCILMRASWDQEPSGYFARYCR